jgi:hypothetical protein
MEVMGVESKSWHLTPKGEIMKRILFALAFGLAILFLTGCTTYSPSDPTPYPTLVLIASPTPLSVTPTTAASATPNLVPTATVGDVLPGSISGPYAVIRVTPGDVLNIRSAPGTGNPISGSFAATATTVMRTGPSSNADGDLWVQVQNPVGGLGWVNASYLTEYVAPAAFCADARVITLLGNFRDALKTSNGETLSSLVSPLHGMAVRLWRNGNAVLFYPNDARWIFVSTYEHNWGAAPGSGLDTIGAIHMVVLPKWMDVFNSSYSISCDVPLTGGASYDTAWPAIYANVNYYALYKPGPAGNELSWRTLLIGVEYVQGQPYIFSVTQMDWEP